MLRNVLSGVIWGGSFIGAGVLWALYNLNVINFDITKLWPLIFVIIGIQMIIDSGKPRRSRKDKYQDKE